MLNLILPLVFALLFLSRRVGLRILLSGIAVLIVMAVIATYSRSGFVTLGVIGLAYMVVMWRGGRRGLAISIVLVMIASVPFLPPSYLTRLNTIANVQADVTGSAQTRMQDMLAAAKYIGNHPLVGAGIGQDVLALNEVRGVTWTKVHNVYLEYAVDLGLPGLGLFLLLLYWILRNIYQVMNQPATDPEAKRLRTLAEGIGVSLTGFAVAAMFYPDAYEFYFYYMAGLAMAAKAIWDRRSSNTPVATVQ